jgi:hypothetical protein
VVRLLIPVTFVRGIFATLFTGMALVACMTPDIDGTPLGGKEPGGNTAKRSGELACSGPSQLTPEDPNKLPKCACAKGGAARCVPKDKIPASLATQLESCEAGACVPDDLVKSGGAAPPTCQSAFGEGRCMNLCVPEVASKATLLTRGNASECGEDERCVPCLNPLKNNEPTGVCEIGKAPAAECNQQQGPAASTGGAAPTNIACPYTGPPIVDVKTFPSCGDGARCVPTTLVPATSAGQLAKCDQGLCAPEKSIAAGGQYLPKTCKSLAGAEGRCLNVVIPAVASQKATLPQDVCDANERCTPCFSPADGKDTGACKSVSCDAPKQPAVTFKGCCEDDGVMFGKCVPKSMVPASSQDKLDDEGCVQGAELCAPKENLDPTFKPQTCTANNFFAGPYSGVCVSDCIDFSFIEAIGTSKGNCQDHFTCVPCERDGQPTGAPGCPP